MYAVEFTHSESGERQVSRYFETVGKARNWGKWLAKHAWAKSVRVMAGGAGGMEVWRAA